MSDLLKDRARRSDLALKVLHQIIKELEKGQFLGEGRIEVRGWVGDSIELVIPLKSRDHLIWEEVLYHNA